jgi:hypothetical protein
MDPTTEAVASDTVDTGGESLGESTSAGTEVTGDASGSSDTGAVSATGDAGTTGEETGDTDTGEPRRCRASSRCPSPRRSTRPARSKSRC